MSDNITPFSSCVDAPSRYRRTLPHIFWLTGLSGSGKSTLGAALEKKLHKNGFDAFLLDGDNVRGGLCADLGFSAADRAENIRRISHAARLIASSGQIVIVCAISPEKRSRELARETAGEIPFTEVYVSTPLEVCASRDPKGLYKRAFAGEISGFTGVDAPYEAPESPDIEIDTSKIPFTDAIARLYEAASAVQTPLVPMLRAAVTAALEAGREIMRIYEAGFGVEYKADASPVTEADRAADAIISARLRESFPHAAILSEETADVCGESGIPERLFHRLCFIVDPLDGTKEFTEHIDEFTVNIALAENHRAVLGVVYRPATGTLYTAARGMGAYKTADARDGWTPFDPAERIRVSDRTERLVVMDSRSHKEKAVEKLLSDPRNAARIAEVKAAGSSLKGCLIAEGIGDVHYRYTPYTKEWDTAAMQCICEEAGAVFTRSDGSPMLYNRTVTANERGFRILNRPESALAE